MLLFVGAIIVLGSVLGGFMIHGGHVLVLNQPAEFVIIGGAALGSARDQHADDESSRRWSAS